MKIGCLGNTNNYPFMVARALSNLGHEVLFIVDSQNPLHRPEYRYSDISIPYPGWIYDLSPLRGFECVLPTARRNRIVRLLRTCDAVVLNHFGPSLLTAIGRPAVVLLTGDDLEWLGSLRTTSHLNNGTPREPVLLWETVRRYVYTKLISAQRRGIRAAAGVSYFSRGLVPEGDALLDEIGVLDSKRVFLLMTEPDRIPEEPFPHHWPVRTFCATRLTWKKPRVVGTSELDYKGSDIMIRGLGLFWRSTGTPLDIRLVKKGMHVSETMQLVEEEGLAGQVTWLEEMSQIGVWAEFRQADIVFEQFGQSVVGMAGLDAMAMARPVIANGRPEILERLLGVPSPICQAETREEVCAQLQRLVRDPAERERVGRASRKYVEEYFSAYRAARICLDRLV